MTEMPTILFQLQVMSGVRKITSLSIAPLNSTISISPNLKRTQQKNECHFIHKCSVKVNVLQKLQWAFGLAFSKAKISPKPDKVSRTAQSKLSRWSQP